MRLCAEVSACVLTCGLRSGWIAQEMCSSVFGAGLDEATARDEDLGRIGQIGGTYTIDYVARSVTGLCRIRNPANETYTSIFRDGIGCTLVEELSEAEIRAQQLGNVLPPTPLDPLVPWPVGEGYDPTQAPPEVDVDCLARVAADQLANENANMRAMVVVYRGQLVYEAYAPGITKDNRLLGWSATKSLTQAMVGILAGEGRLDIYKPAPIPEWRADPNDPRQNITIDQMLRMSSGTVWNGDIGPTTQCIFWSNNDCAGVCAEKPLETEPDSEWNYNSGSSYLLSRVVNEQRGDPELTNWEWPKHRLFWPIGAHSMYIEAQPNSNFLGGAYGYGTARDWARFGLLFQRGGVWVDGTRILPEGWTDYAGAASSTNDGYAAHFWKNPTVDARLYYASGFRNENVYIFPTQELVVARLAMPAIVNLGAYRPTSFLLDTLACFSSGSNVTTTAA
jgi:CubicO group peptidase (beta-lactamase class C family)